MNGLINRFTSLAFAVLCAGIFNSCLESSPGTVGPDTKNPKGLFGVLVDAKGKPVAGTSVKAVLFKEPIRKSAASKEAAAVDSTSTDSTGTFVFENLESGVYNLQGDYNKGSLVVLIKDVQYDGKGSIKELKTDTLRAPGQIAGQVNTHSINEGGTLCYIPGTSYLAITNDSGQFVVSNLPQGAYSLTCSKDGFIAVSDSTVEVQSEKKTVLAPKSMEPDPAYPPPAPVDIRVSYDTVAGVVRLAWSQVVVSDLDGYLIFRNEAPSTDPQRINPILVRDTFYVDSVYKISDTSDLSLVYRVKAQDKNADISAVFSKPVSVTAPAPLQSHVILPTTVFAGDTISVKGLIQSGTALTSIEATLWSGNTDVSLGKGFVISSSPLPGGKKKWDLESDAHLRIISDNTIAKGKYALRVVVRAGSRSSVDSIAFDVTDDKVDVKTLAAGAQASVMGSFIDLDTFRSFGLSQAMGIAADIDLVFAFSGSTNSSAIYSPEAGKNGVGGGAGFDFLQGLNPANKTEIKGTTANFGSIQTRKQIDSLWNSGVVVTNGRLLLSSGAVFLAKSNKGLVVLIQATDVIGSSSGTANFSGKAKF